jgi:hypothetical protein
MNFHQRYVSNQTKIDKGKIILGNGVSMREMMEFHSFKSATCG